MTAYQIKEWTDAHPRWPELLACLRDVSDPDHDQMHWAFGPQPSEVISHHFLVAVLDNEVVGLLKFHVQPIGPPDDRKPILVDGLPLTEAKITAFGVRPTHQRQGIGTELQKRTLARAATLGCW